MLKSKVYGFLLFLAVIILTTGFLPQTSHAAAVIQNYPMPSIYTASNVFSLKADNQSVPVISYKDDYDYAQFSFSGAVSIEVTANVPITSYSISPMAKNIEGTVNGNKLTFTLSSSTYVIVKINDQTKKIVIAADPLETNIPPSTGAGIYNVTQSPYNADNTGTSMASNAIQQAIDAAYQAGGGIVFVPAGVYKSGNLTLKSNVTFYLAGGAVIVGTGKGEDYVIDFRKDSRNADGTYFIRTAVDSSNITIRGRGTIDGKGIAMRERKMPAPNKNEGFLNNLLVPIATTNFTFDGLILRDGGFWSFMVVRSDNVTIKNLKGFQDLYKIENDVIDINESQNVLVKHAIAISDDDTYSTKTWLQTGMSKGWPGALEHLENVVFDDAFAWTRCAAFKIGMGVAQPQIGVTIRNSYVYQSARALLIDHGYQYNTLPEEGYAQNITFENIDIERVGINQFGNYWLGVSTSTSGDVNNVVLKNINVRELGSEQSRISGNVTKGGMVNGVMFSDVYVKGKLATNLSDLKVTVNSNVNGINFANSKPLFSDNFEDGDTAGWTSVTGGWTVPTDGTNKVLSSGSQTTTSLITANAGGSWTDYAYEARVKMGITDANAGIVFRVQDANNYYMYRINSSNQKLELYKSVNGQLTSVANTPFTAQEKQFYTVKAVIKGNKIFCYVDGELKMEWTNPVTELTTGGIGFRTTSAGVHFDDVTVTPILLFSDNFEDGNTTGWASASGSWSVTTDGTKVLTQNNSATALITAGDAWTDYTYEAKVKMPIANANAGIIFRVQNENNYYMYRINVSNQKLELYKSVNGQLTLVSSTSFTTQANQWYTIKASVQGTAIKGYVNGALKTEWTNPVTELTAGKIGFRTTSAGVSFDDALVLAPPA
ncbi:family 16 glycoside hydrolase [Paenibacillus sp. FSL H7-0331]|uniref:family 16 glycoside hydrolase n=1 Tax=Paenibacillus sp. FSL H7-0331 TaxID=1920421 RepID=UPI0030FC2496